MAIRPLLVAIALTAIFSGRSSAAEPWKVSTPIVSYRAGLGLVNLDCKLAHTVPLTGPAPLEIFGTTTGRWSPADGPRAELRLPGSGRKTREGAIVVQWGND